MIRKVYMLPTPSNAANDLSNSINQIVQRLAAALPEFGYEITEDEHEADLVAGHAGASHRGKLDVAHCHGLYPTAELHGPSWYWAANREVIHNLRSARATTVPSQWVADLLRRDMHRDPAVIGWAIEPGEWEPSTSPGTYVLWGKTRSDGVCSPETMNALAAKVPDQQFVATFGVPTPNVVVIGRHPFEAIKPVIQGAGVYLADVKETFGIMTLEAMACGVPVLGYRWGATPDLVEHGVTGYLVEPGDLDGLVEGLAYIRANRFILSRNARLRALDYTWHRTARQIAGVYDWVLQSAEGPKVSVIIPVHNYEQYVGTAIDSVKAQRTMFNVEIIVVDDASSDGSAAAARDHLAERGTILTNEVNMGVAETRNRGIASSHGQYIVCLDADDVLGDARFLQVLADGLDEDRTLGIAFTGLTVMDADGKLGGLSQWPNGFDFERQVAGANQVPTCCMFRREAWAQAGGYRRAYQPSEDARLWLMMGALGWNARQIVRDGWFHYRIHDGSLSDDIRKARRPEPAWRAALPWIEDKKRPFASMGFPTPNQFSWPVRNYDQPLVTIIVPVGPGHERYIVEALDSIEAQTDRRWRCLVVNDTGHDLELPGHPWAKVIPTAGGIGAGAARNLGITMSRSRFVAFLDADDVLEPTFLDQTLKAAMRTGRYAYTDWISLNKQGQFERHNTPDQRDGDQFMSSTVHSISVVLPREWAIKVGGFDDTMSTWEDVDFFMRLAAAGYCGIRVPEPLLIYRYTTGHRRETGAGQEDQLKALLRERYYDYIVGGKKVVCICDSPVGTPPAAIAASLALKQAGADEWVRVEYSGPKVARGSHAVVGAATRKYYGQRSAGDIFLVYRADLLARPDVFHPITTPPIVIEKTPVPPAPVLISAEPDGVTDPIIGVTYG